MADAPEGFRVRAWMGKSVEPFARRAVMTAPPCWPVAPTTRVVRIIEECEGPKVRGGKSEGWENRMKLWVVDDIYIGP